VEEKDCIILINIYKEQNLGRAAKKLYLTPPALTYRIQQLETRFSVPIIKRNGNQIFFTPEGEELVSYAKKYLADLKYLKDTLLDINGTLRIGASSVYSFSRLPTILSSFLTVNPQIKTHLNSNYSGTIFKLLTSGNIHLGIVRGDYEWPEYRYLISQESICIVSKDEISLEDLPSLPCIKVNHPASSNFSDKLNDWWIERFEFPPLINTEVNDFQTSIALVEKGLGYAIIPSIFLAETKLFRQDLFLRDGQPLTLDTWLMCTNESKKLTIVDKFINHIQDFPASY
jgi:DNA-binding transcriptional LysR family regulator